MSLISQIRSEHAAGFDYVQKKRTQYRERIKKWNNQSKGKINVTLIANQIDTLISSSYTDLLTVKFVSRDGFFGKEKADQLTYLAQFDQQEQNYDQLYYQKEQDRYFFGVSIRLQTGWDNESQAPEFVTINPLSWIPDPLPSQKGKFSAQEYRFHWFVMRTTIYELRDSWLYNKQGLNDIVRNHYEMEEELNRQAYNNKWNYWDINIDSLTENFSVEIYHHFTWYEGKKVLVTTDANIWVILREVELAPVLKEEKDNKKNVPRPIALNYWKPERWSAFGESICDYLEDKQDAINIFANLNVAKAKKEALGGRFLLNSRLIKNKEDILKPSVDTQYFWIDENNLAPWESLANAMMELPQPTIRQDTFAMTQYLEAEANKATWVDQLQRGIVPDKSMTKAEAQQIQANANLLSIRNKKVDSWWDKEFWFLRWRAYNEFFSPKDKKTVVLDTDFETKIDVFTGDVFKYKEMPHIMIGTSDELNAIDEKRKQFLSLYLPQVKQDPNKPQLIKDMLEREFLRLQWYSQNQINVFVPLTKDERIMLDDYIPMLNNDTVPKWIFMRIKDPFTAYIYTLQAKDTKAKTVLMNTLKSVMKEEQIQAAQWMNEIWNSAANIQMAQAAQQTQTPDLVTRGNLATTEA